MTACEVRNLGRLAAAVFSFLVAWISSPGFGDPTRVPGDSLSSRRSAATTPDSLAQQEEPPREAIWLYRYDTRVDGVLEKPIVARIQLTYENGRFSGGALNGKVRDYANNAVITAELLSARTTPILVMKQYQAPAGGAAAYYAACAAYRAGKNIYRGTWYDCAGVSGDFEMVLKEHQ